MAAAVVALGPFRLLFVSTLLAQSPCPHDRTAGVAAATVLTNIVLRRPTEFLPRTASNPNGRATAPTRPIGKRTWTVVVWTAGIGVANNDRRNGPLPLSTAARGGKRPTEETPTLKLRATSMVDTPHRLASTIFLRRSSE